MSSIFGQCFNVIASAEWINCIYNTMLIPDNLLCPKCNFTALSDGSANVSSIEFVCSDCVPPSTAANASMAVLTYYFPAAVQSTSILLSVCGNAVSMT